MQTNCKLNKRMPTLNNVYDDDDDDDDD